MDKRGGFTLVELVIVIAVLAVVLGAVFFTVSRRDTSRREILAAADILMSDIRYARQRAVASGARVIVSFNGANDTYTIRYFRYSWHIRQESLPSGITFEHAGFRTFEYLPRGTPSGGSSVTIISASHRLTISVVGSGGRVRISDFREVS